MRIPFLLSLSPLQNCSSIYLLFQSSHIYHAFLKQHRDSSWNPQGRIRGGTKNFLSSAKASVRLGGCKSRGFAERVGRPRGRDGTKGRKKGEPAAGVEGVGTARRKGGLISARRWASERNVRPGPAGTRCEYWSRLRLNPPPRRPPPSSSSANLDQPPSSPLAPSRSHPCLFLEVAETEGGRGSEKVREDRGWMWGMAMR